MQANISTQSSMQRQKHLFIWISLSPIILYFAIFSIMPILGAFYISLHDWPLFGGERTFVGIAHYIDIIQEERFWTSMKNTFVFAISYVFFVITIGLALALLLTSLNDRVRLVLRPLYFAPQVTSVVAVAIMFSWIFQPRIGVINYLLSFVGLGPYNWLSSISLAMPTIILTAVWRSIGYTMVIFTAGLLNIPRDLYDAAAVDGASPWIIFWRITLPMLRPTTLFVFVTSTIAGFQVFVEPWLMTGGGPGTATRVVMLEIYDRGFRFFEMGNATALAVYLFSVIAIFSAIQMRYLRQTFEM